jgi:hypothetical protein
MGLEIPSMTTLNRDGNIPFLGTQVQNPKTKPPRSSTICCKHNSVKQNQIKKLKERVSSFFSSYLSLKEYKYIFNIRSNVREKESAARTSRHPYRVNTLIGTDNSYRESGTDFLTSNKKTLFENQTSLLTKNLKSTTNTKITARQLFTDAFKDVLDTLQAFKIKKTIITTQNKQSISIEPLLVGAP